MFEENERYALTKKEEKERVLDYEKNCKKERKKERKKTAGRKKLTVFDK